MKNTFITLEALFITSDGKISEIFERRVTSDPDIYSKMPVQAVLELNGGTVEHLGIKPGDTVSPKPTKLAPSVAVDWTEFSWESGPYPVGYHFTLQNKSSRAISRIKYVVVFYGSDGVPIHSVQGELFDTILGGLSKTLDDSDSCQHGCLPSGIRERTARVEVRVLNYEH
jgi:hypothetical protein